MRATMKILLVSVLLALIGLALVFRDQSRVEALLEQIRALGPWGPLAFILLYGIAPLLFVPGFPLTLAGGGALRPDLGHTVQPGGGDRWGLPGLFNRPLSGE